EFDLSFLDGDGKIDRPQNKPCGLYNAMIAPLVPFTVKGFLWYQGESNRLRPDQYRALMPAFVKMLRERWAQGELPFYYVQIAPYCYENPDETGSALLREAQLRNLGDIPSSGMAVTMDIGDENCIHPARKEEVGTRLAWLALTKTYGMKGIDADTPVYEKMEVADGKAYLTFRTGREGLAPLGDTLTGFEVAGADRVFHPATARIEKGKGRLIVTCDAVAEPVAVRYAFRNYAEATLFNSSGIPASSFRTDDWEVK
ncbi:MAG: sialate O-acetylesterase, partial [Alistipes senegalensis]